MTFGLKDPSKRQKVHTPDNSVAEVNGYCCKVRQQCTAIASSPSAPNSIDQASVCCEEEQKQQGECEASALRASKA